MADDAAAQAQRWLQQAETHADRPGDEAATLALAWAIKDACYAAWSSEPQAAVMAAAALQRLQQHATTLGETGRAELQGLVAWTAGIASIVNGEMARAAGHLEDAAAQLARAGKTAEAAQTSVPRIMALTMLGRHDDAVAAAEAAQARFIELGDLRSAAKVALNLGSLHLHRDAYAEGATHYRRASALFARIADRQHSVMADIGIGDSLAALGEHEEARRIYARARMRAAQHALPVLQAVAAESTALLELACGHYGLALAGFEEARRRYEQLQLPQQLAIAEKQLADAYLELRLLPEALDVYGRALDQMRTLAMPDDTAWTLAQRGRALSLLGQDDAAAAAFEEAGAVFEQQRNAVGAAAVHLARAELALSQHDAGAAQRFAAQAAAAFSAAGLSSALLRAQLIEAQAQQQLGQAMRGRYAELLQRAEGHGMVQLEVRALGGLGQAALDEGDIASARGAWEAAVARFEAQRRALPGDDVRITFLVDHLRPYQGLLRLALDEHARAPTPQRAARVLHWLDRTRARTLGERLLRGPAPAPDVPEAALALRARLGWLNRRLQQQEDEGESPAALEAARRDTEQQLLEVMRRHRLALPVAAADDDADVSLQLPRLLQPGDAVVEFGIDRGLLFACVVRPDGTRLVAALARLDEVLARLRATRFQMEAMRPGHALLAPHMGRLVARVQTHLQALHAALWAPLAAALAGARRVQLVTPSELATLPFSALHDGQHTLDAQFELALAPSALWACRGSAAEPVRAAGQAERALVLAEDSRLQHTAAEARSVLDSFTQPLALIGAAATAEALRRHAPEAAVVHIACHAEFRSDSPLFSSLHLADGPLTAESAEQLGLPGSLVVLSACETGLAGSGPADEHLGLVRAFLSAGASRVLASLWAVDDAVTARFMHAFYAARRSGAAAAAALNHAQATVRAAHPHPYYWAAFVLYGGW